MEVISLSYRFQSPDEVVQVFFIFAEEAKGNGWVEVIDGYSVRGRTVVGLVRDVTRICNIDSRLNSVGVKVQELVLCQGVCLCLSHADIRTSDN